MFDLILKIKRKKQRKKERKKERKNRHRKKELVLILKNEKKDVNK